MIRLTRRDAWEDLQIPKDQSHTSCSVVDLVFWLEKISSEKARSLLREILQWLAMLFEFGTWWEDLDSDLLNTPILQGPHRARRLPTKFKEQVVRMAAKGQGFKSNFHVCQMLARFKGSFSISPAGAANEWTNLSMAFYYHAIRQAMTGGWDKVFSLAWDGTRFSGLVMLFATLYTNGMACWCPHIAPRQFAKCVLDLKGILRHQQAGNGTEFQPVRNANLHPFCIPMAEILGKTRIYIFPCKKIFAKCKVSVTDFGCVCCIQLCSILSRMQVISNSSGTSRFAFERLAARRSRI